MNSPMTIPAARVFGPAISQLPQGQAGGFPMRPGHGAVMDDFGGRFSSLLNTLRNAPSQVDGGHVWGRHPVRSFFGQQTGRPAFSRGNPQLSMFLQNLLGNGRGFAPRNPATGFQEFYGGARGGQGGPGGRGSGGTGGAGGGASRGGGGARGGQGAPGGRGSGGTAGPGGAAAGARGGARGGQGAPGGTGSGGTAGLGGAVSGGSFGDHAVGAAPTATGGYGQAGITGPSGQVTSGYSGVTNTSGALAASGPLGGYGIDSEQAKAKDDIAGAIASEREGFGDKVARQVASQFGLETTPAIENGVFGYEGSINTGTIAGKLTGIPGLGTLNSALGGPASIGIGFQSGPSDLTAAHQGVAQEDRTAVDFGRPSQPGAPQPGIPSQGIAPGGPGVNQIGLTTPQGVQYFMPVPQIPGQTDFYRQRVFDANQYTRNKGWGAIVTV